MGRKKLSIEAFGKRTERQLAFRRRRQGIIRKSNEIAVMCNSRVALFIFTEANNMYQYSSRPIDSLIHDFCNYEGKCQLISSEHKEALMNNKSDNVTAGETRYKKKIPFQNLNKIEINETDLGLDSVEKAIEGNLGKHSSDDFMNISKTAINVKINSHIFDNELSEDDLDVPDVEGFPIQSYDLDAVHGTHF